MFLKFPRFSRVAALSILLVAELSTAFGLNTPRDHVDERVHNAAQMAMIASSHVFKPGEAGIKHLPHDVLVYLGSKAGDDELSALSSTCRDFRGLRGYVRQEAYRLYVENGCDLEAFRALGRIVRQTSTHVISYHANGYPGDLPNRMEAIPEGLVAQLYNDGVYLVHGGSPMHRRLREQMLGHGGALPEGVEAPPTQWRELTIFDLLPHVFPARAADADDSEAEAVALERFHKIALSHRYGRFVVMCHQNSVEALIAKMAGSRDALCADLENYVPVSQIDSAAATSNDNSSVQAGLRCFICDQPYDWRMEERLEQAMTASDTFVLNYVDQRQFFGWVSNFHSKRLGIVDIDGLCLDLQRLNNLRRGSRDNLSTIEFDFSGWQNMDKLPEFFLSRSVVQLDWRHFWRVQDIGSVVLADTQGIETFDSRALLRLQNLGTGFACRLGITTADCGSSIVHADFSGLSGLSELPEKMLSSAGLLGSKGVVRTQGLEGIRQVGKDAFRRTFDLRQIDFSGFCHVEKFDQNAFENSGVAELDFSPMQQLQFLGNSSFASLGNLAQLRLVGLAQLQALKGANFKFCAKLEELIIEDCPELQLIGDECFAHNKELKRAVFRDLPKLEKIGDKVLAGNPQLEEVILEDVPALSLLGNNVLEGSGVRVIDFSHTALRIIGDQFAARSPHLQAVVYGDAVLERLGGDYLRDCRQLTEPGWSAMRGLTEISSGIVRGCRSLTVPGFDVFSNATEIGDYCFYAVGDVDLSNLRGLSNVTKIGDYFLAGVTAERRVNFDALREVVHVGHGFAHGLQVPAQSTETLAHWIIIDWPKVQRVGNNFMAGSNVVSLDMIAPELEHVGSNFLAQSALKTWLTFDPAMRLKTLGENFFRGCDQLRTTGQVHEEPMQLALPTVLQKLQHGIPAGFFAECASLAGDTVALPPINGKVGDQFLAGCARITDLPPQTWAAFDGVTEIGDGFMAKSGLLLANYVRLKYMRAVQKVGAGFLFGTPLRVIDLDALESIEEIGPEFCEETRLTHMDESTKAFKAIGRSAGGGGGY